MTTAALGPSAAGARGVPARAMTAAEEAAAYVARYRWLILLGLITAAIMEVLDTTIVNVALPHMAGNLGATQEEIGWVATGYILSNVIFLPMTAFFTERFGRQRYLTASIILFIVASFFCGTSDWLGISLLAVGLGSLQYVLEEGNSKDWFSNAWITRLTVIAAVSLLVVLWWELTPRNRHPVVNFRVL